MTKRAFGGNFNCAQNDVLNYDYFSLNRIIIIIQCKNFLAQARRTIKRKTGEDYFESIRKGNRKRVQANNNNIKLPRTKPRVLFHVASLLNTD
jgi:hypothetical protein